LSIGLFIVSSVRARRGIIKSLPTIGGVSLVSFVAAYRFVDIADPQALRTSLFERAAAAELKGTVLLAHEGINLMLAGERAALGRWMAQLQADPRFATLELKQHAVNAVPFRRLRVKVKREIIRMNQPALRPADGRAKAVDAHTLARWLATGRCDEGREVVMLDTRNGFEVDAGAFEGAIDWRLEHFSDFPHALAAHRDELAGKTIVSYCTGGIRCEKAALWMAEQGLPHVHQLDGGILRYLEQLPDAPHWRGGCFVFDQRGALDPSALHS
jgi:UPF0176 protein